MKFVLAILTVCALASVTIFSACGEEGGGIYCCTYESRHTACGGGDWTA